MRYFLLIILISISTFAYSQSELNFYINDDSNNFPEGTTCWIDTSQANYFNYFIENIEKSSTQLPHSLSNLKGKIWLLIPIDSTIGQNHPYTVITNTHTNYIQCWWLNKHKKVIKACEPTGDRMPFNTREIITPSFTFQNPDLANSKFILIAADKRNEIFHLNVHFSNLGFIENRLSQQTALFGWLIGIVAVIFIITWVLFYFAKDRLYFLYGCFLFFMLIYSVADFGFWHWIIAFDNARNLDFFRPITLAISFVFYVLFILRALNVKENIPKLYKALRVGFFSYIAFIFIALCIYLIFQSNEIKFYGVLLSHYFQRLLLVLLILIVVKTAIKKLPFALLISISLFLFLGVHVVNYSFEKGFLPDLLVFQHFLPIVYTVDCLIMSVIISRTFIRFQKKSLELTHELLLQNINFSNKLTEVKEKDLTRISQYLHDNIGAEISAMRYELEALRNNPNPSIALDRIIAKSSFIANEVRNASHNLSPLMLERFGLKESIAQFLTQINSTTPCNFQLDVIGDLIELDKNLNIVLFQIIQECVQNILKHAQANNTIIQILNEPNSIQLFVEDDGVGFDQEIVQYGLGLDSIQKLVELKNGVFKIVSEKSKGVKIYVELPKQSN